MFDKAGGKESGRETDDSKLIVPVITRCLD
jgi:hypothetical protein